LFDLEPFFAVSQREEHAAPMTLAKLGNGLSLKKKSDPDLQVTKVRKISMVEKRWKVTNFVTSK
jgi:hypothetical protein